MFKFMLPIRTQPQMKTRTARYRCGLFALVWLGQSLVGGVVWAQTSATNPPLMQGQATPQITPKITPKIQRQITDAPLQNYQSPTDPRSENFTPSLESLGKLPPLQITVTTNLDAEPTPDDQITLREAVMLTSGALPLNGLSKAEQKLVQVLPVNSPSQINFALPSGQTTIKLRKPLPHIVRPNLVIDGTTQQGYDKGRSFASELHIPRPLVEIMPANDVEIFRGFVLVADNITLRGLSIHGFNAIHNVTAPVPPADIFIAHRLPPPDTSYQQTPAQDAPYRKEDIPPKNILLEYNWLGVGPDGMMPSQPSAFGVALFNTTDAMIRRNRMAYHESSAIITSVRSERSQILNNAITGNGLAGMPDAIRLEGYITEMVIKGNLVCGNDGAGVYMFKPEGSGGVRIEENRITANGRGLRRAAVYLMGHNHQVVNNRITHQGGSGVAVAAYPKSDRNIIRHNFFATLEGLSIDLLTQRNVTESDFRSGEGVNPWRNSHFRRVETGNGAINAPEFFANQFFLIDGKVGIDGKADPDTEIDIYRVNEAYALHGPLSEHLATIKTDAQGKFQADFSNLKAGDLITAIATDPQYGTSEPATNARISNLNDPLPLIEPKPPDWRNIPVCLTPPTPPEPITPNLPPPQTPTPPIANEPPIPPQPIRIKIQRNIHFALDKDYISPRSAEILDRVAAALKQYPSLIIDLEGHTDPRASDAYNIDLGLRRARSARNYLLSVGIAPERMTIRTFGERNRRTTGDSIVDYARDRRVEIQFQDTRGLKIEIEDLETDLQLER